MPVRYALDTATRQNQVRKVLEIDRMAVTYVVRECDTKHPEKTQSIVVGGLRAQRDQVARVVAWLKPV
jgi:hypothetical protein